jgi:hypothetical protein
LQQAVDRSVQYFKTYMKRNPPIGIIVVLALVGITFMIWSVGKSKKKSDKILEDFNKVDNSFKSIK